MKFNKLTIFASGLCLSSGLALGFYLSGNKNLAATVGISSVGGAMVYGAVSSQYHQKKIKGITEDSKQLSEKLNQLNSDTKTELTSLQKHHRDTVELRDKAIAETKTLLSDLATVKTQLSSAQLEKTHTEKDNTRLQDVISQLNQTVESLQQKVIELEELIEDKEAELEEFNRDYKENLSKDLEIGFEKRKKEVIAREIKIDAEITSEAIELMQDYKDFVEGIMDNHYKNRELLLDTNNQAKTHIQNLVNSKNEALSALQEYNERLQLDKAILQQRLNGELHEPIYKEVGYALHGKIANDIAKEAFRVAGIPLEVLGYQQTEETTRVGYGFSKTADTDSIIQTLKQISQTIAKELKIHAITNIELSAISPVINLTFRKEPPKPESVEEIYKSGLIPANQFCDVVAKATDHKTKGKPTLRVMAATGEGKGICVKNLLAYFADIEGWEIWLSDPLHGSDEDYWDTPKIAANASDAGKAYKLFCKLHHERHELKQEGFTDRSVLGVFDEFDKQHSDDDKEQAKKIMTAIRHSQQRQILIGQCAEVGSNGWAWDDMKNCSLLVLGASIGSLVKHLTKDFGWTKKKENQVKREYERFSTWADNQNANNPDIPDENQTRIALLVSGDRYQFLEVPIAHKGILKNGKATFRDTLTATSLSINTQNAVSTNSNSTPVIERVKTVVRCPHCTSTNLKKNGKHKETGKQLYTCKDCKGSPRTWSE